MFRKCQVFILNKNKSWIIVNYIYTKLIKKKLNNMVTT